MPDARQHPDLFTAEEAIAYLRLDSESTLQTLREKWGLRPLPIGNKSGLYHREHLDDVVRRALSNQKSDQQLGELQGARPQLRISKGQR